MAMTLDQNRARRNPALAPYHQFSHAFLPFARFFAAL